MNRFCRPKLPTFILTGAVVSTAWSLAASSAHADVVGRLRITVKNVDNEKPVAGAQVTLHDPANVRPDTTFTTDATGIIVTDPLENRPYTITTQVAGFDPITQQATVVSDATTDVNLELEPVEKTIKVTGNRNLLRPSTPAESTQLSQPAIANAVASSKNPQQLDSLLVTTPGIALDSNNQAHPRGEHTQTSIYVQGIPIGGALVGRFGPLVVPEALSSVDVLTGGFAPEYGSETAAILNTTIRSGTITPTYGVNLGAGGFSTRQGSFIVGGQLGAPIVAARGSLARPGTRLPGAITPGTTAPGAPTPGTTTPGTTTPGSVAPGTTAPNTTAPDTTTPGVTTPGVTAPGTTTLGATTPGVATVPGTSAGAGTTAPNSTSQAANTGLESAATPVLEANQARRFSYFINGTTRSTDNALEPPQPDDQTAHNHGSAQSLLGRFDYAANQKDNFTVIFNDAPANTQVANRTGLPASFANVGQGFGYGGARNADGTEAGGDPNALGGGKVLLPSQQTAGQDINQKDNNGFGVGEWRHNFSDRVTSLFSLGIQRSKLDVTNNNPLVGLGALPVDNSIEYNPTVSRNARHNQAAGSVTFAGDTHTVKVGGQFDAQRGSESYNITPDSQLALDGLFVNSPGLVPQGAVQVDAKGNPVMDTLGNPIYLAAPDATSPTVGVNRKGSYAAAYLQDTWKLNSKFTTNYGLRYDYYHQTQTVSGARGIVDKGQLSPRVNLSYALQPTLVLRTSYNRLFIQPPLAEGVGVDDLLKPETLNQYDLSLEKQLKRNQTAKLAYYYKQIDNQIDIALLVPGSQIGIYRAVNIKHDNVHGVELSYELQPDHNVGSGAYVSLAHSTAKFLDYDGSSGYNDHDQRNTLSAGYNYTLLSGASLGTNFYYGSGTASSVIGDSDRHSRTRVDIGASTGPKLFGGHGGLRLDVDNVFNNEAIINFNSDFSGTRFQQGRRVVLSAFSNF